MTQPGENSPQDSPDKNTPERGPDKDAKKPRGMGGVFIIMLLLLALILIVSRSADQSRGTPYDFWWRLYNARFSKILLGPDSSVTAQYENADGQMRKFQTNFKQLTPDQQQTIQDLQAVKLDRSLYESRGIAGLIDDIEDGSTQIVKAWVIDQTAPHKLSTETPQQTGTEPMRQQQSYVTAIVVRGSGTKYVKIPSSDRLAGLLAILKQREVPVQIVPLAPDARFEIEKVDQWTIYFLSTIGPWILIIALFWFFIIRQMRSPGGTGGVLSFGRSRVHRYNKEQRTQVTFDDVEGMDEAKEEVRE
ncbi:MAG: hypothetical protein KDC95_22225, partial [Planctomycetes bacterium]|nr:hypothetical protein [Planctomycetota bacterium]